MAKESKNLAKVQSMLDGTYGGKIQSGYTPTDEHREVGDKWTDSDVDSTMSWVAENLKGEITIGFSTSDMRDNLKIIGQPISLIIDTDGNILSREYGYVPNDL